MSADDITLGGKFLGSPRSERPTAPIDCSAHQTPRSVPAPRAVDLREAQEHAAGILSGSRGLMDVGRPGIEEMALFVCRITSVALAPIPVESIDPDDIVTLDVEIDCDDLMAG